MLFEAEIAGPHASIVVIELHDSLFDAKGAVGEKGWLADLDDGDEVHRLTLAAVQQEFARIAVVLFEPKLATCGWVSFPKLGHSSADFLVDS